MELTFNDIFIRNQILTNIPTEVNGQKLSASTTTSLLLLRIAYQKKVEEYEEICKKALEELKKDEKFASFDEKYSEIEKAKQVLARKKAYDEWDGDEESKPSAPSEEEIRNAESVVDHTEAYDTMVRELSVAYNEVRTKQASVETSIGARNFTRAELEDLVSVIGPEENIAIKMQQEEIEVKGIEFLSYIANFFS